MPTIVESTRCHLWTDALHARQLARETLNKWDRGTYVRMCVIVSWTALEVACQDALARSDIGRRFKEDLNRAIEAKNFPPLDWSGGIWQKTQRLQEFRKSYVHRFASLQEMFPDAVVAEEAVETVREAIRNIYAHANSVVPTWIDVDEARGWPVHSMFGIPSAVGCHPDVSMDDPLAVRVFLLLDGREQLARVFPSGYDSHEEIEQLLQNSSLPISGIRIYENGELTEDLIVNMRGSA